MKKLLMFFVMLSVCMFTFAQDEDAENEKITKVQKNETNVHPENFSHWSISVAAGANLMLGDNDTYRYMSVGDILEKCTNWSTKFQCEYMINPRWGVQLEYMYLAQNKKGAGLQDYAVDKDLQMHEVNFSFLFNILNIVRRTRRNVDWNLYAGIGAGLLNYQTCVEGEQKDFEQALTIPMSVSVEYTPTPALGIFIEGQYKLYSSDRINGLQGGTAKDMNLYAGLGLRYHICATKKPHVHNVDQNTYEPITVAVNRNETKKMQAKIDSLTKQIGAANQEIEGLKKEKDDIVGLIDSIAAQKVNMMVTNIQEGDNVNVAGNNYVNIINQYNSEDNGIYFKFDSDEIEGAYFKDVIRIASRMSKDNKLKIKIVGYCDSEGSVEYNKKLAQRRCNALMYILVNRYRISKDRIYLENVGRITGENEINAFNRRVDVEYFY